IIHLRKREIDLYLSLQRKEVVVDITGHLLLRFLIALPTFNRVPENDSLYLAGRLRKDLIWAPQLPLTLGSIGGLIFPKHRACLRPQLLLHWLKERLRQLPALQLTRFTHGPFIAYYLGKRKTPLKRID
ncbi:hypothetical protein N9097_00260, partial [bacterium]|nr:hypothetical protein [bacterium]